MKEWQKWWLGRRGEESLFPWYIYHFTLMNIFYSSIKISLLLYIVCRNSLISPLLQLYNVSCIILPGKVIKMGGVVCESWGHWYHVVCRTARYSVGSRIWSWKDIRILGIIEGSYLLYVSLGVTLLAQSLSSFCSLIAL